VRDRRPFDPHVAQHSAQGAQVRKPPSIRHEHFRQVVAHEPESIAVGIPREQHHSPAHDAHELAQPAAPVRPMMEGQHRQTGVEGPIAEGQRLCATANTKRRVRRPLRDHHRRWFHGDRA
jgi:hypothetical protein